MPYFVFDDDYLAMHAHANNRERGTQIDAHSYS